MNLLIVFLETKTNNYIQLSNSSSKKTNAKGRSTGAMIQRMRLGGTTVLHGPGHVYDLGGADWGDHPA